ncbi:MAG: bifunctional chorismate mutase/prephenate dehydratase [bacterium]|nr:bifunctional chorismate mutase/prephenate dehydratase [bacterium]
MKVGYQGEGLSYSDQAAIRLYPEAQRIGFGSFARAFQALGHGDVDRLVLPIENSTIGSILPVLDRLARHPVSIIGEHLIEVRHALIGLAGSSINGIEEVWSHPQALAQADDRIEQAGWNPIPVHDTAGAVRTVVERGDPSVAALAPRHTARRHGGKVLLEDFLDRDHNTTRFVILAPDRWEVSEDANKTSMVFETAHSPGSLALALTELGLRGANLTHLQSRPAEEAWRYRFYADMIHSPGPQGVKDVLEPRPATLAELRVLGTYPAATVP